MPLGLGNAPAVFHLAMNQVLFPFLGKVAMVYLNDIIIFSESKEGHAKHLEQVFEAFQTVGLTSLDLLGYVISKDGITAQSEKTSSIGQCV